MLPGREQTLCCKDCIKLQAVRANRFLHVLQHVRAQLPSFLGRPFGRSLVRVVFGSQMVTVAVCCCDRGGGTHGEQILLQEGLGRRWPEQQSTRTILGKNKMPRGGVFLKRNTCCVAQCNI